MVGFAILNVCNFECCFSSSDGRFADCLVVWLFGFVVAWLCGCAHPSSLFRFQLDVCICVFPFHVATADQVSERHIRTLTPSAFPEKIVERLECNSTEFDKEWKTKLDAWTEELNH